MKPKELKITTDPLIVYNNRIGVVHTEFESVARMLQFKIDAIRLDSIKIRLTEGDDPITMHRLKVANLGIAFILMRSQQCFLRDKLLEDMEVPYK